MVTGLYNCLISTYQGQIWDKFVPCEIQDWWGYIDQVLVYNQHNSGLKYFWDIFLNSFKQNNLIICYASIPCGKRIFNQGSNVSLYMVNKSFTLYSTFRLILPKKSKHIQLYNRQGMRIQASVLFTFHFIQVRPWKYFPQSSHLTK